MSSIPVNGKVLEWARNHRKLSLDDAAVLLEISTGDLESYEKGTFDPSLGLLRRMAKQYDLPLASLVMPDPLPPVALLKDFRTIEGEEATITHKTSIVIDYVRARVESVSDLLEESPELLTTPKLPTITFSKSQIPAYAKAERNRLGLTIDEQLDWTDYLPAFRAFRRRIERLGIFVHLIKMPMTDCRGFSLFHGNRIPVIVINDQEDTYQAKTFTLFHEYAHLLLRNAGICDENRENNTESFCNLFAAHLLMPHEILERTLDLPDGPREWDGAEIKRAAREMKVSQQALVIHLEDLGFAPEGFYDRWQAGLPPYKAKAGGGVSTYAEKRLRRFGHEYSGLVIKALDKAKINRVDAFEMLHLKPKHFPELRKLLRESA